MNETRVCGLPNCFKTFTPTREWQKFCCVAHGKEFDRLAWEIGRQVAKGELVVVSKEDYERVINADA